MVPFGFPQGLRNDISTASTVLRVSIVGPVKAQGTYDPLLVPTANPSTIPPWVYTFSWEMTPILSLQVSESPA